MALLLTFSPVPIHPPSSLLPLVPGGYVADTFSRLAYRTRPLHCLYTPGAIGLRQCGGHAGPRGCPPPYACLPLRLQALPIWLSPLCGGHRFSSALLPATGAGPGPRPRAGQSQGEGKESRSRVGVGERWMSLPWSIPPLSLTWSYLPPLHTRVQSVFPFPECQILSLLYLKPSHGSHIIP